MICLVEKSILKFTYEYDSFYKILPAIYNAFNNIEWIGNGKKVPEDFRYISDKNKDWMSVED